MLNFNKKMRKDVYISKYIDLGIENMSDEEFSQISKKVYISIALRCIGGTMLFVFCILVLVVGGRYAW